MSLNFGQGDLDLIASTTLSKATDEPRIGARRATHIAPRIGAVMRAMTESLRMALCN